MTGYAAARFGGPMAGSLAGLLTGLLALLSMLMPAFAQDAPQRSPLGVGPPAAERGLNALRPSAAAKPAVPQEMSSIQRAWAWVLQTQQRLNRDLVAAVRGLKTDPVNATFVLAWLSFAYGVLHAAGPGHGKAVISAYVLANERTVKRGIMLSFLAAFFQALSALIIVGVLSVALKATSLTMKSAEAWIETLSWAMVAGVGAWLLYGQLKPIFARRAAAAQAHDHAHGHEHGHVHTHTHDECCDHSHEQHHHDHAPHAAAAHTHAPSHAHHAAGNVADHVHSADCGCGHSHMPSPKDLEGAWSWSKALTLAISVGIRPCTGAILVLLFAISQGLVWAGVMATFAMAIGTAITVSALAALAVGSRELATKLAGGAGSGWAGTGASAAAIVGSSLVLLMGAAFFVASLKGPAPF